MFYEELSQFITSYMHMSHIYQPVMLMTLLQNGGVCHERDIAKAILLHDESQIEYYTRITNNMVGRVLRNHSFVERDRNTRKYHLIGYSDLTPDQVQYLIMRCEERLNSFLEARGMTIFDHRRKSIGYISGTIKYEVLRRAKFHCELCGISAEEKALQVDHIIPRIQGGKDDLSNYQALCYSCNSSKRDRDATDFHSIRESFLYRDPDCLFCTIDPSLILYSNELVYAIRDNYPVTNLHTLIIPKRHCQNFFELGQSELNACYQLLQFSKSDIEVLDKNVEGFNVGVNSGEAAGQTIFHTHIHLIPRRLGDVESPRGGVRHVIPRMGNY